VGLTLGCLYSVTIAYTPPGLPGLAVGIVAGGATGILTTLAGSPGDPKAAAYAGLAGAFGGGVGGALGGGIGAGVGTFAGLAAQQQFNFLQQIGVFP